MSLLMCQYFIVGKNLENANTIDLNDNTFLTDKKIGENENEIRDAPSPGDDTSY